MRVDDVAAIHVVRLDQRELLARRDVETAAGGREFGDDGIVGERLDGVVPSHERQGRTQAAVLAQRALRVEEQQRCAVQGEGRTGGVRRKQGGALAAAQIGQPVELRRGGHAARSFVPRRRRPVLSVIVNAPAATA